MLLTLFALLAVPVEASADFCQSISGLRIVSQSGVFLGTISSPFDSDSVLNEFGDYGSQFSDKSIWNEFGKYGGEFSDESPFNEFANKPPLLIADGDVVGTLSVSKSHRNALNPYAVKSCQ